MPVRTGIAGVKQAIKEQAARAAASRKWIFLRDDGDAATLRFLSDIEDSRGAGGLAIVARFHQERPGQGRKGMGDPKMCSEDETCSLCTTEGDPSRLMALLWTYVYFVDHAENREQGRFGGEEWKPVSVQGRTYYRERIEGARVLQASSRLTKAIMGVFGQEGTLLDRDWSLTRTGARGQTEVFYQLYPLKVGAFEKEVPVLVSLTDYAEGRVTLSGEEVTADDTATARAPVADEDLEEIGPSDEESEGGRVEGYDGKIHFDE